MPTRVFSPFPSLDFFGKSIPGVILSLLLVSLLPVRIPSQTIQNRTVVGFTTSEILLLLLGIVVFGFVVGQGLHTTAVLIERTAFYLGRAVTLRLGSCDLVNRLGRCAPDGELNRWLSNRWLKTAFEPHRKIFEREVRRKAEGPGEDAMIDSFLDACCDSYGDEFVQGDGISRLYPLVMSDLNNWKDNRAGRFQNSYTFSRSVWVEFLTFAVIYYAISLDIGGIYCGTPPIVSQVFPGSLAVAAVALFVLSINFMYASSIYKEYFVQYIFADFTNYARKQG